MEKNKKNTAVEWLQQLYDYSPESCIIDDEFERAKETEQKQKDEFANGFVEWCVKNELFYSIQYGRIKTSEILEIYKKQKGL